MDCAFCEEKTDSPKCIENGFGVKYTICPECMRSLERENKRRKIVIIDFMILLAVILFAGFVFLRDLLDLLLSIMLFVGVWSFSKMDANEFARMISTTD